MFSSFRKISTSSSFSATKYSSMHGVSFFLNSFRLAATPRNTSLTADSSLASAAFSSPSGTFVYSALMGTPPATKSCNVLRMSTGAFGASIMMSSQVQNSFSKLRTKPASSMMPCLLRAHSNFKLYRPTSSSPSIAHRMAMTPNSSADGHAARSSRVLLTVACRSPALKYSSSSSFTSSWKRFRVQLCGISCASSASSPKVDDSVRAGRREVRPLLPGRGACICSQSWAESSISSASRPRMDLSSAVSPWAITSIPPMSFTCSSTILALSLTCFTIVPVEGQF
mmetsp:Transcript_65247/g.155867  ORF Transcript_65247/g.155867 Transcript_65247/m.155867 type:complete len:283 (-) Transcript_65247:159-1007(-)